MWAENLFYLVQPAQINFLLIVHLAIGLRGQIFTTPAP